MSREGLAQLKAGQLQGQTKLAIEADLTEFPMEILDLAETLEVLDLSRNNLTALPPEFAQLKKLKIFFASQNPFEVFPDVLSECPQLSMIGFKSNRIRSIPEPAFPPLLRWLILTDNQIANLPNSIGALPNLQKLMLAGNQLRSLPSSLAQCHNLELLRLSANQFETLPDWLFDLPKLAWLATAGNPIFAAAMQTQISNLPKIPWTDLTLGDRLGEGASGIIWQADWQGRFPFREAKPTVAVKLFKGAMTSDGLPQEEMQACLAAGSQENLVGVLGEVCDHPDGQLGLVLPMLDRNFEILGNPPSFESCTRDTFTGDRRFKPAEIIQIATGIAQSLKHLHDRGITHGDLYAHNILVNPDGHPVLSDFGAATVYGQHSIGNALEKLEVRAFGYLLEDLLEQVLEADECFDRSPLDTLKEKCLCLQPKERPGFEAIVTQLRSS